MTWASAAGVGISGAGLLGYFLYERERLLKSRQPGTVQSTGKPAVGGPFSLVNHDGYPVTDRDFLGRYMLIYFGYTFCPDICPEELDRMAEIANGFDSKYLAPIFISCDPKRDSVGSIKEYLKEFHPEFIGMTGTYNQIKRVAKAYRLYFSAPPQAMDEDDADYLVDHSIFFYLMDPDGRYVEHFGRNDDAKTIAAKIMQHMKTYYLERK